MVEACDTWQTRGQDCGTINSTVQKENGLECTEDDINQVCLEMTKYAGNRVNQAIMRTWGRPLRRRLRLVVRGAAQAQRLLRRDSPLPLEVGYDPVDGEWFPQFCNQQEFVAPEGEQSGFNGGFPGAIDRLAQAASTAARRSSSTPAPASSCAATTTSPVA